MKKKPLTKIQHQTLEFIKEFFKKNGYMPSLSDIGKKFKIVSTSSASERLQTLIKKGYIKRTHLPRDIEIL